LYKVKATYLPRDSMEFDFEYYFRKHVPLAKSQADAGLNILGIDVESKAELLMQPGVKSSPCIFSIYLEHKRDVDVFREFMASEAVAPMREDVVNYTNCELEWTVCEVTEV